MVGIATVAAYPVLLQVEEDSERCFRLNIPEDDDSHLVFLPIPNEDQIEDEALESWYFEEVYALTKAKSDKLPEALLHEPPAEVARLQSDFLREREDNVSKLQIRLTDHPNGFQQTSSQFFSYKAKYFQPHVINYVRRLSRAKRRGMEDATVYGFHICLTNKDTENQVEVIFDSVLVSEHLDDDAANFRKDEHLTPLEQSLDQSIDAAQTVLREMKFLEMREARMRQTAESINGRVRWFSYLSVGILLSVTYVQVTYLKRYFQKKKLM